MTELWVERTGVRRYTGRSSRGAEVLVGSEDVEGVFTPGELLKIALAACSGMSSDHPLRSRLGDDYQATIKVSGPADREQERYPLIEENLEVDLSGLSEDEVNQAADRRRARHRQGVHGGTDAEVGHRGDLRGDDQLCTNSGDRPMTSG